MFNVDFPDPCEADVLQFFVLELFLGVELGLEVELFEVVQLQGLEIRAVGEGVVAKVHLAATGQKKGLCLLRQGLVV